MSAREHAAGPIGDRLAEGRARAGTAARRGGAAGLFALQRAAGNSAVSALIAGKFKSSGDAVSDIDKALHEVRGSEPDIGIVEKGLKATKAAGVQVDIDGEANKPPASALAVVKTGFGPGSVAPKKPVPPTKPVKAVSPLGKAGAKAPKPARQGRREGRYDGQGARDRRRRWWRRCRLRQRPPRCRRTSCCSRPSLRPGCGQRRTRRSGR